ncbi:MAG: hypothetical protein V3U02_04595 [Calditrichia bacterium]
MYQILSKCCKTPVGGGVKSVTGTHYRCRTCKKLCNFEKVYDVSDVQDVYLDLIAAWGAIPLDAREVVKILREYTKQVKAKPEPLELPKNQTPLYYCFLEGHDWGACKPETDSEGHIMNVKTCKRCGEGRAYISDKNKK